jgi:hypothetical protein
MLYFSFVGGVPGLVADGKAPNVRGKYSPLSLDHGKPDRSCKPFVNFAPKRSWATHLGLNNLSTTRPVNRLTALCVP